MTAAAPALACLREYLAGCAARHIAARNEASWAREACRPKVDTGMKQFYTRVKEQKARSKKQQLGSSSVESEGGKVTVVYVRRRREGGPMRQLRAWRVAGPARLESAPAH